MIFAVFDVLLAVNMCINYSFFYIYICSFITAENLKIGHDPLGGHSSPVGYYSSWRIYQRRNEVSSFTRLKVKEGVRKI